MQINSFLTFNGNCFEAMTYYKACLGGDLTFQTLGESPLSAKMPKKMKNCILQAKLYTDGFMLLGTDMVSENGLLKGNNISLSLNCNSEAEVKSCFLKLSEGGVANHPLMISFNGDWVGELTDKFGTHWIIRYNNNQPNSNY